jgi:hypothetical protein
MFITAGMKQVNFHFMLSEETFVKAKLVVELISEDSILFKGLNAIVFLMYKNKNNNNNFHSITDPNKYKELTDLCSLYGINYGFDSCSAFTFLKSVKGSPNENYLKQIAEPCESTKFSAYINTFGEFFPCSFMEREGDWQKGIDVLNCSDFLKDVWFNPRTVEFRNHSIECCKLSKCPCHFIL